MKGVYFIREIKKIGRKLINATVTRTQVLLCVAFWISLEAGLVFQYCYNEITTSYQPISYIQNNVKKIKTDNIDQIAKAISMFQPNLEKRYTIYYANIIHKESIKYGYDWRLVLAIMKAESDFDKHAISDRGAIGLMQIMPDTAEWLSPKLNYEYLGVSSLYDPEFNIKLGIQYLNMMHNKFGDIDKALIAYNKGPKKLMREIDLGKETESEFLEKVKVYYAHLKNSGYKYPA